ncbi:MAG: PEGA domain-containing protein, partial [Planctomycetia bacterium]
MVMSMRMLSILLAVGVIGLVFLSPRHRARSEPPAAAATPPAAARTDKKPAPPPAAAGSLPARP